MRKRIHFIYDDRAIVAENIARIVGHRSYGSVVRNRRSLSDWVIDAARKAGLDHITVLRDTSDYEALRTGMRTSQQQTCYVHFRANGAIADANGIELLLRKIGLAEGTLFDSHIDPVISGFHDPSDYQTYLSMIETGGEITINDFEPAAQVLLPNDALIDLSDVANFLAFFSSGFETRYYNQVEGNELTVVKRSQDKEKIEREYRFYGLLPEAMAHWFVQPYNFQKRDTDASYEMERLGIADMALIWIHGAISPVEFEHFVEKIMSFVDQRPTRQVSREDYIANSRALYVDKVRQRINDLKADELYNTLDAYIGMDPEFDGIESLIAEYETLFERHMRRQSTAKTSTVIGHGDLCFSNILYDKATRIMKFVDPRGAFDESDLWTDPLYDIAKLSHSIFGNYDFINNNLFAIEIDDHLMPKLNFTGPDCSELQTVFQGSLEALGYDLYGIRMCEASLFLSMLPLHKDDPRKVLGFLLRGADIIKELRRND
jgi:hypothetical protein